MDVKINIPCDVKYIMDKIQSCGYEAYIVGGCVRDSILGRIPHDWDITTNAKPNDIIELFDTVIPTGIKHGTVTIMIKDKCYEVTTYRIDGKYTDKRRPDEIEFVDDIVTDLSRRDFTMNAIAYNPDKGYVDPFMGIQHILWKSIITVGKPEDRFKEDYLRMLRAIRFEYQLGFELEPNVYYAIMNNAHLLRQVSKERIQSEINKMLLCENAYVINRLCNSKILNEINGDFSKLLEVSQNNPYHNKDLLFHTIHTIENVDNKLHLKLAALLHDIGKSDTKITDENGIDHFYGHAEQSINIATHILKDLRYDNKTIERVVLLIKYHDVQIKPTYKSVKKIMNKINNYELFKDLINLKWADIMAQNLKYLRERARILVSIECIAEDIMNNDQPFNLKDLDINGNDLINIGYKGKEIGMELDRLLEIVISDSKLNNKDYLLSNSRENVMPKFK